MKEVDKFIDEYDFGSFVFAYYSYLNKFHVEPDSWQALFEFSSFTAVENKINNILMSKEK